MGSEAGGKAAAIAYTLIETAKLNTIDPHGWLADTLSRIPDDKITKVDDLLPWKWRAQRADCTVTPDQEIATVTADGAFDTRKCHDAIAARGAAAIIPPGKNAKPWKPDTAGAVARNEILRTSKRVDQTIWRRWSGCHRRSRAEI